MSQPDEAPASPDPSGASLDPAVRRALLETERDAVVGRLLRGIAHDLNNPISSLSGFAELLEEAEEMGEQERRWAKIVRESAERAASLARSLLAFGRQAREGDVVEDPVELLEGTLALARLDLERKGIEVEFRWERVVPAVDVSPGALQHIALNLLFNAGDAMEDGGGGTAVLELDVDGDAMTLVCRDEGPGVPGEIADRIFEPLYTTREERVGIGLTAARWLAEEGGGSLEPVAEPGSGGAAFRVELPLREEPETGGGPRALVVDRASELRMLATLHLSGLGFEVDEAGSAAEAGQRARGERYDLILADVPDRAEGEKLLAALDDEAVERLLVTTAGLSSAPEREWLDELGRPVLRKPYGKAELETVVESMRGVAGP